LRIVSRDRPVRRSITRIGIPSRKCQRRITLNNTMSITPCSPDAKAGAKLKTWGKSRRKRVRLPGQFSVQINTITGPRLRSFG
jgi:hypothetical protein